MLLRSFAMITCLPILLFAQGTSTAASTLKLPEHAIAASLGDLSVVLPGMVEGFALNPADLYRDDERPTVSFSHASWIQDVSGQRLNVAIPFPLGRAAFGIASTTVAGIEVREIPGPPIATFDAHSAVIRGAWSLPVTGGIVAGIGASYLYEKMYAWETSGVGFDAGILASGVLDGLTLGASLTQVGSLQAFRAQSQDLPTTVRLGGQYSMTLGSFTIQPAAAWGLQTHTQRSALTVGGTATYDGLLSVRAAWKFAESAQSLSVGAGVVVDRFALHVGIVPFSSGLGTGQVISLSATL